MPLTSRMTEPSRKMYKLDDVLNFGQYKGCTIRDVADDDPRFLFWCLENIDWFDLDVSVTDYIGDDSVDYQFPIEPSWYERYGDEDGPTR